MPVMPGGFKLTVRGSGRRGMIFRGDCHRGMYATDPEAGPDNSAVNKPLLSPPTLDILDVPEAESRQPIAVAQRQVAHLANGPHGARRISRDSREMASDSRILRSA